MTEFDAFVFSRALDLWSLLSGALDLHPADGSSDSPEERRMHGTPRNLA